MPDPGMQVDPAKVIEVMKTRFANQIAAYEQQIAMQQVAIETLQLLVVELESPVPDGMKDLGIIETI